MIRSLTLLLAAIFIAGCALGPSREEVSAKLNARFDDAKARTEQKAHAGQITWVQAATQVRDLDKKVASVPELQGTWKFDSDDAEYHAYCIAMAGSGSV